MSSFTAAQRSSREATSAGNPPVAIGPRESARFGSATCSECARPPDTPPSRDAAGDAAEIVDEAVGCVHLNDTTALLGDLGCPFSAPINRDFPVVCAADLLEDMTTTFRSVRARQLRCWLPLRWSQCWPVGERAMFFGPVVSDRVHPHDLAVAGKLHRSGHDADLGAAAAPDQIHR
ncbi:MAG: hypothetical protein K0R13_391 [Propionibacteriaceae bacterium]|nr:hypothetical protein [Propionibacteriaceae bacterium]